MAKKVYVPEAGGIVEFPDSATPQQMLGYINTKYPRGAAPAAGDQGVGPWESAGLGWLSRAQTAAGGIAEMLGSDDYSNYFYNKAQANLDEANRYVPEEPSITGAETWGGSASALGDMAIQSSPDLAGGLLSSLGGGAAAGFMGAGPVGAGIGALAAGTLYGFQSAFGSNIQRQAADRGVSLKQADEGTAAAAAAIQAPLEALADKVLLGKFIPSGASEQMIRRIVGDGIIRHAAKGFAAEGLTEAAQQAIEIGQSDPEKIFSFDAATQKEIYDAAIGGGILGSFAGGAIEPAAEAYSRRGERQLKKDLQAERTKAVGEMRNSLIARTVDNLQRTQIGDVLNLENVQTPEGWVAAQLTTPDGTVVAEVGSQDDAQRAIDLYNQRTGSSVKINIQQPLKLPSFKIGNKSFASEEEAAKDLEDTKQKLTVLQSYKDNIPLLEKEAKKRGVTPIALAKRIDDSIASHKDSIGKLEAFFSGAPVQEEIPTPVTMETPVAPEAVAQPEVAVAEPVAPPAPEVAAEAPVEAPVETPVETPVAEAAPVEEPSPELTEEDFLPDEIPSEMPIGAVELPIEEDRSGATAEAVQAVPSVEAPEPTARKETRPSATADDLAALQTELFGKPTSVREMTPEQLATYERERDARFPPQEVDVYNSMVALDGPPKTLREAEIRGPYVKEDSKETQDWIKGVYTQLKSRLNSIAPNVSLELQTLIDEDPRYLIRGQARADTNGVKSIVDLATGILRPNMTVDEAVNELIDTLNHEIIHVLRSKGLVRSAEWRMLANAASRTNVPGKKYTYLDKARAVYLREDGTPMSAAYADPDAIVEEAVADMYRDWAKGVRVGEKSPISQGIRGIFNRMTEFFRRIFRAIKTSGHERFFKTIESGRVGQREEVIIPEDKRQEESAFSAVPIENDIAWTPERIDEEIRKNGYFDGRSKAYVGWVDPQEFLGATDTGKKSIRKQIEKNSAYYDDLKKISENSLSPYLLVGPEGGKVFGHEGRHRMAALSRMGINSVPVVVRNWVAAHLSPVDSITFSPQTSSKGSVTVRNLIPINEEYRSKISERMASPKSGAMFSVSPALDTEEFRAWFGDSKAVNGDGTPKVYYHGTTRSFKQFAKGRSGAIPGEDGPFFFSPDARFANDYAFMNMYKGGDGNVAKSGGRVIPVYISVQNPFDFKNPAHMKAFEDEAFKADAPPVLHDLIGPVSLGNWKTMERPDVQAAIRRMGHDGFYLVESGFKNLGVFKSQQVKSVFNEFKEGARFDTRFSAVPLPDYIQTQNEGLFAPAVKKTVKDSFFNFFFGLRPVEKTLDTMSGPVTLSAGKMAALRGKANIVDKNAYIAELESIKNQQDTGNFQRMTADYSATVALAQRRRASHLTASMVLRGNVEINFDRPGDIQSATMKVVDDADSLKNIFSVLHQEGPIDPATGKPGDKRDIFRTYAVAKRGEWLRASGQTVPTNLTPQYVSQAISFTEQNYPEVVEAYKAYQRFNKRLLTSAMHAGLISNAELARLTNQMNYYGFIYEVFGEPLGPQAAQKTASKFKLRAYTGTEMGGLANDPTFVILQNAQFWVDSMAKNLASTKAFELARQMGEARLLQTGQDPDQTMGEEPDVMYFSENGEIKRFAVKDPMMVMALGADDRTDLGRFWQLMGLPSKILRESVTRDPGFMVANLMRDTLSSWITSGADITPFIGTLRGMKDALKDGASYKALGSYGAVGSYDLAMLGPGEMAATLKRKGMPLNVHTVGSKEGLIALADTMWNKLGNLSEASDAATRIAVYEAARAKGATEAEAAAQATEILDFTRRGGSQALGILTKLIPFLNARIQGIDVLYQAGRAGFRYATGRSMGEKDANLGKKFLVRGAMLAAISLALEMMNQGDDDYDQLDDYIKNGNLLVPMKAFGLPGHFVAIPKPFEAGLLFSTMPQQFYKTMTGKASARENIALFTSQVASTFGVNPIPQALLPAIEVMTNHDFYTGLPLVPEGKARLSPELQYNASTSQLAMILGSLPISYNMTSGRFEGISPIVIDNMIGGYGGPLGTYLVQAVSLLMEDANVGPERMPQEVSKLPVVKRFFLDAKSKNPKVVTQAYEMFNLVDTANRSYSRLKQTGDMEALADFVEENRDILRYKKFTFKLVDRLNKLSAYERSIERDDTMSREEKFAAQQRIRDTKIRLAAKVEEINRALGR